MQDTESGSPHPEINRLPVMGIEGPGFETETAPVLAETVSGAQAAQAVIPELQAQYAQNTDLAAWLTVPGTGFGYPGDVHAGELGVLSAPQFCGTGG